MIAASKCLIEQDILIRKLIQDYDFMMTCLYLSIMDQQPNNPLHGITLKKVLQDLVHCYGWQRLGELIPINCFNNQPSINSSLKFLRKTLWARKKVEDLYIRSLRSGKLKKQS